jgi:hypothetical protein
VTALVSVAQFFFFFCLPLNNHWQDEALRSLAAIANCDLPLEG